MNASAKRLGYRSPKNGHLGLYTICSGPDPKGPVPGERIIIVIYNHDDQVVRRLEQVKGDCIDEGYIDFFNSFNCRPALHAYHIVDTDCTGKKQILATHVTPQEAQEWLAIHVPVWVKQYGVPQ